MKKVIVDFIVGMDDNATSQQIHDAVDAMEQAALESSGVTNVYLEVVDEE